MRNLSKGAKAIVQASCGIERSRPNEHGYPGRDDDDETQNGYSDAQAENPLSNSFQHLHIRHPLETPAKHGRGGWSVKPLSRAQSDKSVPDCLSAASMGCSVSTLSPSSQSVTFPVGDGASVRLVRDTDWSRSSLGPVADWPASLTGLLNTVLNSPFPMYVAWGPDLIWFFNDAYRPALTDLAAGFGRPLSEARADNWAVMEPMIEKVLGGDAVSAEDLPLVTRRRGNMDEVAYFTFSYSPAYNEQGGVEGVLCVCIETTAPLLERLHMRQANDRISNLFQRAPGFIAMSHGPDHRLDLTNDSFNELCGRGSMVGKTIREAVPELEGQGVFEILDQVYSTNEPFVGHETPIRLRAPTGELRLHHINFVCTPVEDEQGVVTGIFVEGFDVTETRRSRKEVQRLQNELIHVSRLSAMGTMASTLAHELNQPLTAALSYLSGTKRLLERSGELPLEAQNGLARAEEATARAGAIIRSLREMSKKGDRQMVLVPMAQLLAEAKNVALVGARQAGISFDEDVAPDLRVECDPLQLQQVLVNLLRNAVESTQKAERREVRVTARPCPYGVEICVSDSGAGIDPRIEPHLFEAFQTTKAEGVGIGLSICRTIIEAHGGKIWAENLAGGGARFCFSVPAVQPTS